MKKKIEINTKYGRHICVFDSDPEGGYVVVAKNLPGVTTWGKNLTAAKKMAQEAIELCVESLVEAGLVKSKTPAKRKEISVR